MPPNILIIEKNGYSYCFVSFLRGNLCSIEGYWSIFKRGIIGIYHYVSPKHLHRYCDEFTYRYNTRHISDNDRFVAALTQVGNVRLKYTELTK